MTISHFGMNRMELEQKVDCEVAERRRLEAALTKAQSAAAAAAAARAVAGGAMSSADKEMLDDLLAILRCPVCEDEFVNATISRCYHLFCRGCLENNLKNRDRKCLACKEKFGQDDIKTIYFPQKRSV